MDRHSKAHRPDPHTPVICSGEPAAFFEKHFFSSRSVGWEVCLDTLSQRRCSPAKDHLFGEGVHEWLLSGPAHASPVMVHTVEAKVKALQFGYPRPPPGN